MMGEIIQQAVNKYFYAFFWSFWKSVVQTPVAIRGSAVSSFIFQPLGFLLGRVNQLLPLYLDSVSFTLAQNWPFSIWIN